MTVRPYQLLGSSYLYIRLPENLHRTHANIYTAFAAISSLIYGACPPVTEGGLFDAAMEAD